MSDWYPKPTHLSVPLKTRYRMDERDSGRYSSFIRNAGGKKNNNHKNNLGRAAFYGDVEDMREIMDTECFRQVQLSLNGIRDSDFEIDDGDRRQHDPFIMGKDFIVTTRNGQSFKGHPYDLAFKAGRVEACRFLVEERGYRPFYIHKDLALANEGYASIGLRKAQLEIFEFTVSADPSILVDIPLGDLYAFFSKIETPVLGRTIDAMLGRATGLRDRMNIFERLVDGFFLDDIYPMFIFECICSKVTEDDYISHQDYFKNEILIAIAMGAKEPTMSLYVDVHHRHVLATFDPKGYPDDIKVDVIAMYTANVQGNNKNKKKTGRGSRRVESPNATREPSEMVLPYAQSAGSEPEKSNWGRMRQFFSSIFGGEDKSSSLVEYIHQQGNLESFFDLLCLAAAKLDYTCCSDLINFGVPVINPLRDTSSIINLADSAIMHIGTAFRDASAFRTVYLSGDMNGKHAYSYLHDWMDGMGHDDRDTRRTAIESEIYDAKDTMKWELLFDRRKQQIRDLFIAASMLTI